MNSTLLPPKLSPKVFRDTTVDTVKALSIIGVLLIHISAGGLIHYPINTLNWYATVFWAVILRAAVPLFFMCSGALLLDPEKNISIRQVYTKYLFRILIALFFWAIMYEILDVLLTSGFDLKALKSLVKNIVYFKHHFHLYYLHIIIIVYIFLPITRIIIKHSSKSQLQYTLLVWFVFGILYPFARQFYPFNRISGILTQYSMNMTYSAIGYGILGFYLKKYYVSSKYSFFYLLGFLIVFFGTIGNSLFVGKFSGVFLEGMSPGVAFMAIGLYIAIKNRINHHRFSVICTKLSISSFCIYLVHDFFNILFKNINFNILICTPIISIPILVIANLFLSFCVYLILSKIPVIKKYLI